MPFGSKVPLRGVPKKKKKPIAGPSRSESSIPSIRAAATGHEPADYGPAAQGAAPASTAAPAPPSPAQRAVAHQQKLVDTYVTKAYSKKVAKIERSAKEPEEIGERVERAKAEVSRVRERLLSDPAVQDANAKGKVVPPKGLQKIQRRAVQYHAIQGPKGVSRSKAYGYEPRSLSVGKKGAEQLATRTGWEGEVARRVNQGEKERHEREAPSTLELLAIMSMGIPGPVGIVSDVGKLAALGSKAIPLLLSREGAAQLAKGGASSLAKGAASVRAVPGRAAQGVKGIPDVLRASPQIARAGAKAAPGAAKAAIKGAPRAAGRGAVRGAGRTYQAGTGLGVLAATQNAGINTPPGEIADAILKGTSAAVSKHPGETAKTTLRTLPSAVTAPAALGLGAVKIPFEGTGPLEETAKAQFEGMFGSDDPSIPGNQAGILSNLLSGDPHRAQEAVQGQGALAFLAPLPALTRTKPYKAVRSDMRGAAAGIRRISGKGRQTPEGVEASIFGFSDTRSARKRAALTHSRATNPYHIAESRHKKAILHGSTRRPALERAPKETGHTISTLLDYGIRDMEGVKLLRKQGPKSEPHVEGKVNLDRALQIAEENPEMFTSKPFLRALNAAEKASRTTPAALKSAGEVARYRSQGDLFGITPPDRAVPFDARKFTSAKDREGAWKDLEAMEKRVAQLRTKRRVKGPKGRKADRRGAEIKALESRAKGLRKALDPFTRPGQKTAAGERMFWNQRLEKEYTDKVRAKQKTSPLVDPAWTHHATFRDAKLGMEPGALPNTGGGKVYVRRGSLEQGDLVDRSLEAFIRGTVEMPLRKAGSGAFVRELAKAEKTPYTLNGKKKYIVPDSETWAKISGKKTKENPDGGQVDPKTQARLPIREWGTAAKDPFASDVDLKGILEEAEAGQVRSHEPSLIVPRETIREARSLANPDRGPVPEFFNQAARVSTRLILGTNPTWVLAQIPAEGIPLLLAHPELANPFKSGSILKELHHYRREHPEKAAMVEGAAGAAPEITAGSLRSPLDLEKEGAYSPQPSMFADGAKEMTRRLPARAFRSVARLEPLGLLDIKRQNAYRALVLTAQADRKFRGFTGGVHNWFRRSSKISERFHGKSREEMWTWLSTTKEGKRELAKLADHVDDVLGNWTTFTRYERGVAPFLIFYPFLRYSMRWTLWTFPKSHPVTTAIIAGLGQANANALEKLLGAKPASFGQYAQPVVYDGEGEPAVAPGGLRIAPGLAPPLTATAEGAPGMVLGAANPFLEAGNILLGGVGPFGTTPGGPKGFAAADQLLQMPSAIRLMDISSEKVAAALGLTRAQPQSILSKAFEELDPNRKARQGYAPWLTQSASDARMSNELSLALKAGHANSKDQREAVGGDESLTVQERYRKIKEMEKRSEKARGVTDRIMRKLGLDKENAAQYKRFKESMGWESESGFGGGFSEAGFGGGFGGEETLPRSKYKPPGSPDFDFPKVFGALGDLPLGEIGNTLSSMIGGEKAQAAERKGVSLTGPLTAGEKTFAKTLAKKTTLTPETAAAWVLQEGGNSTGDYNRLNVGHTDSGPLGLTTDSRWKDPVKAGELTADFLKGKFGGASEGIQAILPAAKGKSSAKQLEIIAGSGWATDPAYAEKLQGTLASVGVKPTKPLPKRTMKRFQAGLVAAKELEKAGLPYVWGGGHGDAASRPTGGGLDCSGAVSYVLNKMGAMEGSLVSEDMGSVLRPGPGAVTVFYNPTHTFMRIGKKYFGTSTANPSGGAGFIPASVAEPEANSGSYNVGHVAGLGKKVAVALGIPTGSTGAAASSSFPGMTLSANGTVATITSAGAKVGEPGFSDKPIKVTAGQRLNRLNALLAGDLSRFGIPSEGTPGRPSVSDLAALGRSLEGGRQELMRL